jgi:hypothetical protein
MTPAEMLALTERSYAAFTDGLNIEALIPLYHPDCEWRNGPMSAAFGGDAFRGHDGLRALVNELETGFEGFAVMIDEAKIAREGSLLLRSHAAARLVITQMELSIPAFWQQIEFRDDLIVSLVQWDEPPPGWAEAEPLDLTPDTGT